MGMTTTQANPPLSPPKERRNQEAFFVIGCSAMDLRDSESGILRENAGICRESGIHWNRAIPGKFPRFPKFPIQFPIRIR
jgi:hypothetical protein